MALMKGIKEGFEEFGKVISSLVNVILLTLVYFVGVGITSIAARLSKKSFLDVELQEKETYYEEINLTKEPKENYYRQF